MTNIAELKSTVKVCMFDQYGTVVDMQAGLTKIATPYLQSKGWSGNPNSFVTWWRPNLFSEDAIFLDQIVDHMLLMLVHPAGDREHDERKWVESRAHRQIVSPKATPTPQLIISARSSF